METVSIATVYLDDGENSILRMGKKSRSRSRDLLADVAAALQVAANPSKVAGMQAYMRGQFAFLGVSTPQRRAATMPLLRAFRPQDPEELVMAVQMLWRAREREFQYVAVDLLSRYLKILGPNELPTLLIFVQQKAWWDSVDGLASVVGSIVRHHRDEGQHAMDEAIAADSFWMRRVAMLHQLGWRGDTDTNRLYGYAKQLGSENEFFIQKAIGWALRDYARHDAMAVRDFLAQVGNALSALSIREARRHL